MVNTVLEWKDCIEAINAAAVNSDQNVHPNKRGRILTRWEHEDILDDMRRRIKENKDKVKKRKELAEHPFGTIKRAFNQGYMLLKRLSKVGTEASLTMLVYDITRVINIVGVKKLMAETATDGIFFLLTSRYQLNGISFTVIPE